MKHITTVILISVFIIIGAATLIFVGSKKPGTAVSTSQALPVSGQTEKTEAPESSMDSSLPDAPSPLPSVSQILLTISSPVNGSTVTSGSITVKGITTPKAEVFINDKSVIADSLGSFSVSIILDEGENSIVIAVNDSNGNYSEKELTVTYTAEE